VITPAQPAAADSPLLQIREVRHAFGDQTVLDGVSAALGPGSLAALLGPSGCGKTTLLRLIAGFEAVQHGSILLASQRVSGAGTHLPPERRGVGMVFQDFALFPHLSVADNIAFGLARRGGPAAQRRVTDLLALMDLAGLAGRFPHELSGGQQQRVSLARALAPRPRLVLLDEPFSSLDVTLRERLAADLRRALVHEGAAAILVTHDQVEAFAFADIVGVMHAGRIVQWDSPARLYEAPTERFVADFVGEGAFLPGTVETAGVRTELGLLEWQALGGLETASAGAAVEVLLRPEDIRTDPDGVTARVLERRFLGEAFMLTFSLPSGSTVLARAGRHASPAVGEAVGLLATPRRASVFLTSSGRA
jgi:iron(III) transport system ATP-binding protein